MASNPFEGFNEFIQGAATTTFKAISNFLTRLEILGLNLAEVLLFILFVVLILIILLAPARVYMSLEKFRKPIVRVMNWVRK